MSMFAKKRKEESAPVEMDDDDSCPHCGYALGGMVEEAHEGEAEKMREGFTTIDQEPEQGVHGDELADAAFVDSIRRRRGR